MGTKLSEKTLLEFLSGGLSESREQEIVEQMRNSTELREKIDILSDAGNLRQIRQSTGFVETLPPLDRDLARRLYEFGPRGSSADRCEVATTTDESVGDRHSATAERDHTSIPAERRLGEYELIEEIGSGSGGVVYRARQRRLNRMAAVKILSARLAANPQAILRFHREIETIGKLDHPNIIQPQYAGEIDGRHYLAMEYVECRDLAVVAFASGPLSVGDACAIAMQCASGLQHTHCLGIVHRDIKPSNLLLSSDGLVKIGDFGLAKLRQPLGAGDGWETIDKHVMGTLEFMAPEQVDDSRKVDIRADIYSLGCTLFYLLTGKTPHSEAFSEGGLLSMLTARRNREPANAAEYRADLPAGLLRVLDKMLAPRPKDRYATPQQVCDALVEFAKLGNLPELWSKVAATANRLNVKNGLAPSTTERNSATVSGTSPEFRPAGSTIPANDLVQHGKPALGKWRWKHPLLMAASAVVVFVALTASGILPLTTRDPNASGIEGDGTLANGKSRESKKPGAISPPDAGRGDVIAGNGNEQPKKAADAKQPLPINMQDGKRPKPLSADELSRRKIAKWLLENGAKLTVEVNGLGTRELRGPDLPESSFIVTKAECCDIKAIDQSNVGNIYKLADLTHLGLRQTSVKGADLKGIDQLKKLKVLDLWEDDITNAGLKHLKSLRNLEVLNLRATGITDAGLKELLSFERLNLICLKIGLNKRITNDGVRHLVKMKFLSEVGIDLTGVNERGLRELGRCQRMRRVFIGDKSAWNKDALERLRKLRSGQWLETSPY